MRDRLRRAMLCLSAALLVCVAPLGQAAHAQKAEAVPQLDLNRYLGAWYVQAWIPAKAQKRCTTNVTVLYAAGDGKNAFQMGTFCQRKDGNTDESGTTGKTEKTGGGKLKVRRLVLLSSPHWVLAVAPDYQWALVGTPNHKKLWVLSKAAILEPGLLDEAEKKAAAQGFDMSKLVRVIQNTAAF